jgi:hypothetical protein
VLPSVADSAATSPCAPATTIIPSTTAGLAMKAPAEGLAFQAIENVPPPFSSVARPRPPSSPSEGQSFAKAGDAPSTSAATRPTAEERRAFVCADI